MEQTHIQNGLFGIDDDQLLCTKQLAKLLNVSTQWAEIGRVHGYGPPFIRLSPRMVRYRVADVKEWLNKRAHNSTSEYKPASGDRRD